LCTKMESKMKNPYAIDYVAGLAWTLFYIMLIGILVLILTETSVQLVDLLVSRLP
jgi:hypothetical protein